MSRRYFILACLVAFIATAVWIHYHLNRPPRDLCKVGDPYCGSLVRVPD